MSTGISLAEVEVIFDCNSILSLDDDSLLYIVQFLPLTDKLSFACAHSRFAAIFEIYTKATIKEITTFDLLHLQSSDIRSFFKQLGEHLDALTIQADFDLNTCTEGFTLVKLNCPNLKRLKLLGNPHENNVDYDRLSVLLFNKPNLKVLRLQNFCLKDAVFNRFMKAASQLPQLEHLSIVDCNNFNGFCLKKFTRLKKLRLENLPELVFSAMREALAKMPDLYAFSFQLFNETRDTNRKFVGVIRSLHFYNKKIEILELNMPNINSVNVSKMPLLKHLSYEVQDFSWLTTMKLAELLEQRKDSLQSLSIKSFWNYQSQVEEQFQLVSRFTNLAKLHLPTKPTCGHPDIGINDNALQHLCALQHLVELKLCGKNSFTKGGLLSLVVCCQKLKWVNIQGSTIDNEFVEELISVINANEMRPNGCITFLVYDSRMDELHFPKVLKSKEMQKSVKFIFEKIPTLETYDNFFDSFECDCNFIQTPFFIGN